MSVRSDRAPLWAIWLLIAFGAVQPLVWNIPGGFAGRPLVLIPILVVWIALLLLAALAMRRLQWLWRTLGQKDLAHRSTLGEIEQLRTQNAMLETIARSVDVPLAFQELALRPRDQRPPDGGPPPNAKPSRAPAMKFAFNALSKLTSSRVVAKTRLVSDSTPGYGSSMYAPLLLPP